jgi:hypothetical protein
MSIFTSNSFNNISSTIEDCEQNTLEGLFGWVMLPSVKTKNTVQSVEVLDQMIFPEHFERHLRFRWSNNLNWKSWKSFHQIITELCINLILLKIIWTIFLSHKMLIEISNISHKIASPKSNQNYISSRTWMNKEFINYRTFDSACYSDTS